MRIVRIRKKQVYCKQKERKKLLQYKLVCIFTILAALCFMPSSKADAAAALSLYNYQTKQNIEYTGQQVVYTYNGKTIATKTPGIIIDGSSMASFKDVFVNSPIKMKHTFNEKTGKLTLTSGSTVMEMTLGSKTVLLNGKKVTAPLAPVRVKYKAQKTSKVLVPARFVAEAFGYSYQWNSSTSTASITGGLKLNYGGKDVNYTGTQGKVTFDGTHIILNTIPVMVVDDTALLPAYRVFSKSPMKVSYSYNMDTGEIILKKGDIKIQLTVGSKMAYVNGKAKIMDTAPIFVKNLQSKETCALVPGNFVATNLGFSYTWNNSMKTSQITTKKITNENNGTNNGGNNNVNTGETGQTKLPDTTLFQWGLLTELLESYTIASNTVNTAEISQDVISTAFIESVTLTQILGNSSQKEVYTIKANSPISKTTITEEGNILKLLINNAYINTAAYNLSGILAGEFSGVYHAIENNSELSFKLSSTDIKYAIDLSEDKYTMTVTLYPNYVNTIAAGRKNGEEFVAITAMEDISVTLTESGNYLMLQLPFTVNGVGNNNTESSSLEGVKAVSVTGINDYTTNITIEKSEAYTYRVDRNKNTYTVFLTKSFDSGNSGETETNTENALQFKLPEGVTFSDITTEDRYRYYQNKIAILLPGDQTQFYDENPVTVSAGVVQDVTVSYVGNQTEIVIVTSKLQGFKLSETNNGVSVKLGDPRDIYQNIVLLDPGHGGNAAGATRTLKGVKIMEKDLNQQILYNLAKEYFNAPDSPVKVYYTRYGDEVRYSNTTTENYDRAAQAKRIGADLYVSLHMNSNTKTSPVGTEVYYNSKNNKANGSGLTSKRLGEMLQTALVQNLGTVNRGVKDKSLIVTRENSVPAVLIELGFMSNPQELALLNDPVFQEKAAKTIYDTICQVFEEYPTGR
ncbi:N-acetylmuramoyl-L-alanine amidase [Anaerocolumna aminovalerica]|uniref:N-acetylmuramoyl-L-alanine amidase n=1 Tax=Anaerocolumna aminovalerica TaxID=1527 RepID=UPI001C0F0B7E|nr:N-acetylmuramoyl-L-alanine amidase [Anaerocolumna aminovalerica]MBU5333781.1 N-acetylmuramoyl-L-alanine amidase [Anaerocolumna aminovalerica]